MASTCKLFETADIERVVETGNIALTIIRDMFESFPYAEVEGDGEALDAFFKSLKTLSIQLKG
jgi:hypothetical protein